MIIDGGPLNPDQGRLAPKNERASFNAGRYVLVSQMILAAANVTQSSSLTPVAKRSCESSYSG